MLVALTACSTPPPAPSPASSAPPPSSASASASDKVHVSIGDSYATGFGPGGTTGESFASLVARQSGLRLVNLACNGATSADLATKPACGQDAGGRTQLDAAVETLRGKEVDLVTVVIGGNDLIPCALDQKPLECANRTLTDVRANVAAALTKLRAAAPATKIVGLTYPDVFLGAWVNPSFPDGKNLARLSVSMFEQFNGVLAAEYGKFGAKFADVTKATGAYQPLTQTTQDPKYGTVPASVAQVCSLTYFCDRTDVHPTPAGHKAIAEAVSAAR
ncbi:GDSL-type esterase/lipase family protein [Lentzea sp. NPDC042327]|uniref:SGNH/GDSL hydrolase family protein n=1 Tax=Lentzea sp. NPDC042327 TaxID=3154801 RepID=UPI003404C1BE